MTAGMKGMVAAIFLFVIGLAVGLVGIFADWAAGKWIGGCSAILLGGLLYLSGNVKEETLKHWLLGSRKN